MKDGDVPAETADSERIGAMRIFLSMLLAASFTAIPLNLVTFAASDEFLIWRLIMVSSASLTPWLIGGSIYVWLRFTAQLRACLALGAVQGLLLPMAAILATAMLEQLLSPNARSIQATFQEADLTVFAGLSVMELPFGLFGGWLFWRLAAPRSVVVAPILESAFQRRWRDLKRWRVVYALIVSAGVPAILFGVASILFFGPLPDELFTVTAIVSALLVMEIWCLALAFVFFFAVPRRRGHIRRRDCIVLGILMFCLFPGLLGVVQLQFGAGASWIEPDAGFAQITFVMLALAIMFAPFGLLSGWIFWRVGVRPAQPKDLTDAPVFD